MNTPTHILLGAAAFARRDDPRVSAAALSGALAPDISLYLMAGWALLILQVPAETVFGQYYFSDSWQMVFAVDNSFVLWGGMLGLALWRRSAPLTAFCGAALLHLACDFPLHNDDARMHFWPLTNWVFHSPISYWDSRFHADIVSSLEALLAVAACVVLWKRFESIRVRGLLATGIAAQAAPGFIWAWVF